MARKDETEIIINVKTSDLEKANAVLVELGVSLADAIGMLVKAVNQNKALPRELEEAKDEIPERASFPNLRKYGIRTIDMETAGGHTLLPAEDYDEEDDVYDEYYA